MTLKDFQNWVAQARPGDAIAYFEGNLAYTRYWEPENPTLEAARLALHLQMRNVLALTQRVVKRGTATHTGPAYSTFAYIAQKRPEPGARGLLQHPADLKKLMMGRR